MIYPMRVLEAATATLFGLSVFGLSVFALSACGEMGSEAVRTAEVDQRVEPPFEVRGEVEGLLLVWFDEEGPHTASRRSEIPEAHRAAVRVEDLRAESPLDPSEVFVADLRVAGEDERYPVRRMTRDAFEAQVLRAPEPSTASPNDAVATSEVIIYGASWCNACRSTAAFLRSRNVPFVERDIEREPEARGEMMRAAQAAGVNPSGIPVIDFRGRIIAGFDRAALERAIEETRAPI